MTRFLFFLLTALPCLAGQGQSPFPLVTKTGGATSIYVDANDHWLVKKAASLLQDDIERITGTRPTLLTTLPVTHTSRLVIIGSLDSSATIQRLAGSHKIPSEKLKGKWEAFAVQTVQKPLPDIDDALVITGSDRRGTAYGIFELSRRMGVSPWYWWADVPVRKQTELLYTGPAITEGPPSVKYRGFFINDEAPALSGWAKEKFGGLNHSFYEKVFELLLRLKANYLWPAMWGNAFNDDDPLNPILASQYGIVMGTSHHEPMLRAQQEWKRFGTGPWDYDKNSHILDSFWQKGIEHMDHHESIVTVGMRGDGDKPMEEGSNIALLEKIVKDQRAIIQKVTGEDPASIPQSWALYKEVQDYYDKGMRVPDDVTLLLCDDNWGNVRKLPLPGEKPRGGGYGMYYHFDYVGGPRNYKWLNTNPIARVWEEMHLTKEYGDDRIWMVNVGDIKPMEFPISFFMDYAWNTSQWPADKLKTYTLSWAAEQFGPARAPYIAEMLDRYTMYNGRRKPELLSPDTYSLLNYREAEQVVAKYNALTAQALSIRDRLPAEYHDAYDQLVLFPIRACANLNELYYTVALNRLYAGQGRSVTNQLADKARELFTKDSLLSSAYNHQLAGGKWDHMMDQTHIGYTYWQEPRYNNMPAVKTLTPSEITGPSWGVAVEGSASWWPDANTPATLPNFNRYENSRHFIDLFSRTAVSFPYTITAADPWIKINEDKGTVDRQRQIWISIDWKKAPAGLRKTSSLSITGPTGDKPVSVKLTIDNPASPEPGQTKDFVETDGYVSMDAQFYTKAIATQGITWQTIPGLGRTLSAVEASPVTAPACTPGGNSPRLEYQLYLFDTGTVHVQAYFSPIIEFNRHSIRYGISFDDETPQIIDLSTGNEARGTWDKMVADNIRIALSTHTISRPGKHVLKFWFVDPAVVLQKIVVDLGGVKPSYLGPPASYHSGN
ncbi:MAG TPA: glycosyl hydrolase 115 family protein [Puia sp.]|jgi:hypothetical protein